MYVGLHVQVTYVEIEKREWLAAEHDRMDDDLSTTSPPFIICLFIYLIFFFNFFFFCGHNAQVASTKSYFQAPPRI